MGVPPPWILGFCAAARGESAADDGKYRTTGERVNESIGFAKEAETPDRPEPLHSGLAGSPVQFFEGFVVVFDAGVLMDTLEQSAECVILETLCELVSQLRLALGDLFGGLWPALDHLHDEDSFGTVQ